MNDRQDDSDSWFEDHIDNLVDMPDEFFYRDFADSIGVRRPRRVSRTANR